MRNTWMSRVQEVHKLKEQMKMCFVIAVDVNETSALRKMTKESEEFHDMLVINLKDEVSQHCHKALGFLEYFLSQCYNYKNVQPFKTPMDEYVNYPFYMKITDDDVVFPAKLYKTIESLVNHSSRRFCAGSRISFHPHFVSGSAFIVTNQAAKEIFEVARCMSGVSYMDDITITLEIRQKLNMQLVYLPFADHLINFNEKELPSFDQINQFDIIHKVPGFTSKHVQAIYDVYEAHRKNISETF